MMDDPAQRQHLPLQLAIQSGGEQTGLRIALGECDLWQSEIDPVGLLMCAPIVASMFF